MEPKTSNDRKTFGYMFTSIFVLVLCLEVAFGAFFYHMVAQEIKKQLQTRCLGISTSVAAFLESDPDAYITFTQTLDTESEYFKRVDGTLKKIFYGWENHIIYLGTSVFVPESHRMILFGVVNDITNPLYGPPGTLIELSDEGVHAYQAQEVRVSTHPIKSQYGSYLSAFVPIKDNTGQVIGMVTTRISGEQYTQAIHNIVTVMLSVLIIVVVLFGIAVLFYFGFFEKLFYRDYLTGLYNRVFFLAVLKKHHGSLGKQRKQSFVFMLDLDHFKKINDTYGHPFGDIVLKSTAETVKNTLREADCIARYGGEEFVGLLVNLTLQDATSILNRILSTVAANKIYNQQHSKTISITLSIGCAILDAKLPPETAISNADAALYFAKKTRNTASFFSEGIDSQSLHHR